MSVKESSDELNPPVVTADAIPKPKTRRSLKDYLALAIATCGVGYLPSGAGNVGLAAGSRSVLRPSVRRKQSLLVSL